MPRESANSSDFFLRSINVLYDCDDPERIAHFRPTTKGLAVLRALAGQEDDRAFLVIAPYGTGKSIAATYLLHVIENRDESSDTLATIERRLKAVDPVMGAYAAKRRQQKKKRGGIVLALSGHQKNLSAAIRESALAAMKRLRLGRQARGIREHDAENIQDAVQILRILEERASRAGRDQIVIIWDEFGQHVQTLIAEGRHADLVDVQTLAEYASRTEFPVTLGLLMHQDLIRYAGNLPQSVRSEWAKIEGRFRTIQYVDDSREIYELIADVVESSGGAETPKRVAKLAREVRKLGLFREFGQKDLEQLFRRAYPLEPTTLYLLPRLAARVAQNERTLFNFIQSTGLSEPVSPASLFDYFSPMMQSDTAVGGTYKQWLETKSALAKAQDQDSEDALKTTCLLALGLSGERTRTSTDLLRFALRGFAASNGQERLISSLVDSKLLLHRKHSDEVAVWHGSDADLRSKLEEHKSRRREDFDLIEFLSKETPATTWKPVEYNSDFSVLRYFKGTFHTPRSFEAWVADLEMSQGLPAGQDGEIAYVYGASDEELTQAREQAMDLESHPRVLVAVPSERLPIQELALEVQCLIEMQHDADLVDSDPLVLPELQQMADDAVGHLERVLERLQRPSPNGPRWYHAGNEITLSSPAQLRRRLSRIMKTVFSKTPVINSEAVVRRKPTPVMINARKKLLLGILERYGQENLGIEGNFPDSSIFRSVLLNSGLYSQTSEGSWRFVEADELMDPGLRAVWGELRNFFSEPSSQPKRPATLFRTLQEPPLGVRDGLLPIFFAAGLKAFPSAMSITRNDEYLGDILPTAIEDLCKEPEKYRVVVVDLSDKQKQFLCSMIQNLGGELPSAENAGDLIRRCHDAFIEWRHRLPPAAMSTRNLSPAALKLRNLLRTASDPVTLFLESIPGLNGGEDPDLEDVAEQLSLWTHELEASAGVYVESAADIVRRVLDLPETEVAASLNELTRHWSEFFPGEVIRELGPGVESALVRTLGADYSSEGELMDVLSSLVIQRPMSRWDDSTAVEFERNLGGLTSRVERHALLHAGSTDGDSSGLAALAEARVARLQQRLSRIRAARDPQVELSVAEAQG